MQEDSAKIIDGYPAPVLLAGTDCSADAQFERHKHLAQGAALAAEYDSCTQVNDTNSAARCGIGSPFPLAADFRQKAGSCGALFAEHLIASITVITDSGGADENLRRPL